jgi:hypothetical protein
LSSIFPPRSVRGSRTTSRPAASFIFAIANICLTPFGFPTLIYKQLTHLAWFSPLAAYVLTVWNLLVAIGLAEQFPNQNIMDIESSWQVG